ncbi:MAG: DUF1674 domain-containing protein [Pseudomonadota bacterium]
MIMKSFSSHRAKTNRKLAGTPPSQPTAPNLPPSRDSATGTGQPLADAKASETKVSEIGGPDGPEPTRYGDWERKGICYDF